MQLPFYDFQCLVNLLSSLLKTKATSPTQHLCGTDASNACHFISLAATIFSESPAQIDDAIYPGLSWALSKTHQLVYLEPRRDPVLALLEEEALARVAAS